MTTRQDVAPEPPKRGRGRPAVGTRVHVHIPDEVLADIDRAASVADITRAQEIRRRLTRAITQG